MNPRQIVKAVRRRRRELTVISFMNAIYAFSYFQRVAVPGTIFDELQSDLAMSSAAVALLGGIYLYVYGGMQFFSGPMVDKFGSTRVILSGGALLAVGSVVFPLCGNVPTLYTARFLVGLGASLMFLSLVKELDLRFSEKNFSAFLSTSLFAGYVGGLLGTRPFEIAVRHFGWRSSLLCVGIACAIMVAAFAVLARGSRTSAALQPSSPILPALRRVLRNRRFYPVVYSGSILFANYFLVQAIIGKKFLEDCAGLSSGAAASCTFAMMVVSMFGAVFAGFFSRMIGNRRKPIMVGAHAAAILALAISLPISNGAARLALPCYVLFGLSASASPVFTAVLKEYNEPDFAGTSVGVGNGSVYLLIAIFASVSGLVLDAFSSRAVHTATAIHYPAAAYQAIFAGCGVLVLSSLVGCLFIRETMGRNIWEG